MRGLILVGLGSGCNFDVGKVASMKYDFKNAVPNVDAVGSTPATSTNY